MKSLLEMLPPADVVEKYASAVIVTALAVYTPWKIHYDKWKQKHAMNNVPPVAPMPIPAPVSSVAPSKPEPRITTLSHEMMARLNALEVSRAERRSLERTVLQERERWEYEEQIRRLKKERDEKTEDADRSARETVRLRFEVTALREELEFKDTKIVRLRARLMDSNHPGDTESDPRKK
jgi:hypothetical protein